MNLANLITIARILIVPVMIWLIVTDQMLLAFAVFVFAGLSDAVDGYVAKSFNQVTLIGSWLDPLADKLLLVSIYLSLGFKGDLPAWLVILVSSRDVLIVGGIMFAWVFDQPMEVKPLIISKINTAGQIMLAATVLGLAAFGWNLQLVVSLGSIAVAALTVLSGACYLRDWLRHMTNGGPQSGSQTDRTVRPGDEA